MSTRKPVLKSRRKLTKAAPNPPDPKVELRSLKEKVHQLESENAELKTRLRDLRIAGAATTKVIKAPTLFSEKKVEKAVVKLPPIASTSHAKCKEELQREIHRCEREAKEKLDNVKELHLIEIDELQQRLREKIAKLGDNNSDINRLQNLSRKLQDELNAKAKNENQNAMHANPPHSSPDLSPRIRALEAQIADFLQLQTVLQEQLTDAERTAASCAHIAKVKDEQCESYKEQLEAMKRRLNENTKKMFDVTSEAQRDRDDYELNLQSLKTKVIDQQSTLQTLKLAWTKREDTWLKYDQERNDKWKAEAETWLKAASGKLGELKAGSDLLRDLTRQRDQL
eukprot:m.153493 g.153493  ORF g.153493 m.153493 type:complete len:340 (-) comp30836_c1_seq2:47-1066(-)